MKDLTAVVLGANYYVGLSVSRCLGKNKVRVVATRIAGNERVQYGLVSKYVNQILDLPNLDSSPGEAVDVLINFSKQQKTKPILIPTSDANLLFLEKYSAQLREYYLFPIVKDGLCKKLVDKDSLSILAKEWNVPIPKTILPQELGSNYAIINDTIGYPCLVKPVTSYKFTPVFRCKLLTVNNEDELVEALTLAKEKNLEVFIQQYIKGPDTCMHTYDCYINQDGEVTHWVTFQKHRQFPINFGASTFIKAKHVPELHEVASSFLTGVGYRGFAEVEFKQDSESGKFYMIEINARITNFNALVEHVGMNVPMLVVADTTGINYTCGPVIYDEVYFCAGYEDFAAIRAYIKKKELTPTAAIKSMFAKKVRAVWSFRDPKPFLRFVFEKIKGAVATRRAKSKLQTVQN